MARRTTVLIAAPYFYPVVGGLENYAHAVATGLVEAGFRVVVAAGQPKIKRTSVESLDGLKVYRLPIWFTVSNTPINPLWYFMIRRIIRDEKVDIVNAHTPVPYMADIAALAAGRLPFILTYHAANLYKKSSIFMKALTAAYLPIQSLTFAKATSVFAASRYVKVALPEKVQQKTFIMPNSTYVQKKSKHLHQSGLVFVGSLDKTHSWKGLDPILESLALLKANNNPVTLTVIGSGTNSAHYESMVEKLGLTDSVHFAGQLVGPARNKQMVKAQALITYPTSSNDAFPTVFLEAWSLGLAVISAKIGPIESAIKQGHNGFLADPNDPEALAKTISDAFKNPKNLKKMGHNGYILVRDSYNWPLQVKRTAALLEHLA
jgi:glycosyltransferase involved in cell wall biosynthesis